MSYVDECIPISEWPPPGSGVGDSDEDTIEINEADTQEPEPYAKRIRLGYSYPQAEKLLAGWVRKNLVRLKRLNKFPEICNPKTLLNIAGDTEEGQELLRNSLNDMIADCEQFEYDPEYHYILATYKDKLGKTERAQENVLNSLRLLKLDPDFLSGSVTAYLETVKNLDEVGKNALWLYSKLSCEKSMISLAKLPHKAKNVSIMNYNEITLDKFRKDFCDTGTPVILENAPRPTKDIWTLDFIQEKAGKCKFQVKTPTPWSTEWAGLESGQQMDVSTFLSGDGPGPSQYLFDWSLPLYAPLLDQNFTIPEIFQDNYLKKTSPTSLYHKSWPSLFIAKKGTNSGLHVDAFGSHFWMYLISGKKKWTFYAPEDCGSLNPKFYDSLDPVFRPSRDQLDKLDCYSVVLEEGQLLFVPSGSPHRVENMEDSVAVSEDDLG